MSNDKQWQHENRSGVIINTASAEELSASVHGVFNSGGGFSGRITHVSPSGSNERAQANDGFLGSQFNR